MKIFVDDLRNPITDGWNIARSYSEFVCMIDKAISGGVFISDVSFDHDLGCGPDGVECIKYLLDMILYNGMECPLSIGVHTANPVGRQRLLGYANDIKKFCGVRITVVNPEVFAKK